MSGVDQLMREAEKRDKESCHVGIVNVDPLRSETVINLLLRMVAC